MAISGGDGSIILTTKVDETGLKKGLGSMKKLGATAGKVFLAIGAAVATATVSITKMAVSAYADYEQLVGGVETLFKGSAQKVIDYASDAFFTAGVSANEYMRQVTSFSASLIRSTAGDTDKAADIANMALIDISDNVNKMGSSMESVTLAYQGFAKQQYMLLDNLKLGYGGTKTEMERLLRDAEALTGVKYDINNLADVYSAIHVIQEELGITGTTAKEAEKTITGSANMMKAAWQNVLSAIAGGGDLDRAINNLVYSITKYFENIVPVVQRSLVGIGRLIEQAAPLLVQNVASALIQAIPSLINAIYQMIVGLAKGIWQGIKALFTGGSGSVTADIKTSVGGIASSIGDASTGMEELGDATEQAGKQAKKSLAAFDDLNIISSGAGGGTTAIPEISTGGIGGANVPTAETTMDIKVEETGEQTSWLSERFGELAEAFSGLQDIDLSNLSNSLGLLEEPLQGLAELAWDIILWGIETVIVPLTELVVEDVLPRFFETLSNALSLFKTILEEGFELFEQFYDEFLEPIASYAADEFLKLWDDLNEDLEEFVQIVEGSTAWEDLQTILSKIYDVLEPIVKWIIEFVGWIGSLQINNAWTDIKWLFLDIEDALGLIADIINGDFDSAWEHLKDLMLDNRIDKAKDKLDNLGKSFDKVKTKVESFVKEWKNKIEEMVTSWQTKISNWWTQDVEPWFTKEKWIELLNNLVDSFSEIWENIKDVFLNAPEWFSEKFEDAKEQATTAWDNAKTLFSDIWVNIQSAFVDTKTWFGTLFEDAKKQATSAWDNAKTLFSDIWENIQSAFDNTKTWFSTLFGDAKDDSVSAWDTAQGDFSTVWENIKSAFVGSDGSNVSSWFFSIFSDAENESESAWGDAYSDFYDIWDIIKMAFDGAEGNKVSDWFSSIFSDAENESVSAWGDAYSDFSGVWEAIKLAFSGGDGNKASNWFGTTFSEAWTAVQNVFSNWGTFFEGLWETITTKFSEIGTSIATAISSSVKSGINGVITMIENTINKAINLINGAIGLINKIPGVNISTISTIRIPRLAQGSVIPPNREFLAVLGDNTKEHEIVSPISTMKQAFTEAIAEMSIGGQTQKEEHYYLDETEMMRIVYKLFKGGERLNGDSLLVGGSF